MAKGKNLTGNQERLLRFLYEARDREPEIGEMADATGLTEGTVRFTLGELQEMGMVGGPPSILKRAAEAVAEHDPKLTPTSRGYSETMVLVASILSKADESFLADCLGFDREFVGTVGSRLRAAGVWAGDHLSDAQRKAWASDDGGICFQLDAAIATGDIKVVGGTPDNPEYQMTDSGRGHVERLMRR